MSELNKTLQNLTIDSRAYNFMKATAITNIVDALIELITNSDDAYQKNKKNTDPLYKIDIDINYESPIETLNGTVSVRDQACGLTAEDMQKCLTVVGTFNSNEIVRGFFSRGAKDISALGKVCYESIKDGKYSKLNIYEDSTTKFDSINDNITETLRNKLKITKNGTIATIYVKNTIHINEPNFFYETFPKTLSIRNIMSSNKHQINIKTKNYTSKDDRDEIVRYKFPRGNILLDMIYTLPKYGVEAHFTIFKFDKPYSGTSDPRFCESGFMITSGNVIHGIETFDKFFKFNPDLKYLYGSIHCNHINKLLYDFDKNTSNILNPFPLIDPNRISGINRRHPFFRSLMGIPKTKIEQILIEFDKAKTDDILMNINLDDFSNLAKELQLIDLDLLEDENSVQKMIPDRRSELIKVTNKQRLSYITVERNFMFQLHQLKQEQDLDSTAVIELTPDENKNIPSSVRRIILENGKVAIPVRSLFEQEFIPPVLVSGNYTNIPEDKASDYELYRELTERIKNYDVKNLYIQDRLNTTNNIDDTADSLSKTSTLNQLQIKFTKDTNDNFKYKIKRDNKQITIIINTGNSVLKEFMNTESNINGTTSSKAIIMLNEMLTDAFVRLLVQKDVTSTTFSKLDSTEVVNALYNLHDNKVKLVEDQVFEIIKKLLERRKSAKGKK